MSHSPDERMVAELLAPEIVEMLQARRSKQVRAAMEQLLDPEAADLLMALDREHRAVAFRLLPDERAADVFEYLDQDPREELVEDLNSEQVARLLNEMDPDDRVDFIEDAPEDVAASMMQLMSPDERAETEKLLEYPEQSVGRLATPDFMTLPKHWTAEQALRHIRQQGREAETLHTMYVVDDHDRLVDHVRLRDVVLADPDKPCESLSSGHTISLRATDDREEAVRMMERYDLPVLPVLDERNRLIGIVTFDDVADVASEEATEDMHKMAAMEALEDPYLSTSLASLVRKRGVWLLVLFGGGLMTVMAMSFFEEEIQKLALLALFVPLIIASGGNSGSQAATLIIRAMAIGEVRLGDWLRVMGREMLTGLVMGTVLGVAGLAVVFFASHWLAGETALAGVSLWRVAVTIAVALVGVVTTGTLVGSMLPFGLQRIGLDPATSSTPFVATIVDVAGLLIYFTAAMLIIGL